MRRTILFAVIFLLLLLAPAALRYWQFYDLSAEPPSPPPSYAPITAVTKVAVPPEGEFEDDPTVGSGFVMLDVAHDNDVTIDELSFLDGRLSARGFELLLYDGGDLATALRPVSAFVVIAPRQRFNRDEVRALGDFVDRGGRLLLVGDPARFTVRFIETDFSFEVAIDQDDIPLNSLANNFDIIFNGDYLYNTNQNEGNFRNIILEGEGIAESPLTTGIERLAFYGSHSVAVGASGEALLTVDDNTRSSDTDRAGGLALAVQSRDGNVIALGDINFLTAPYYSVYDNGRFIAALADFLTATGDKERVIADFPFFYDDAVDLVFAGGPDLGPDAFDEINKLRDAFADLGRTLSLVAEADEERDALIVGIYNQAADVADALEAAGVTLKIEPPIVVDGESEPDSGSDDVEDVEPIRLLETNLGNVQMAGSALLVLDESDDRARLIVLAASGAGLENALLRLHDLVGLDADNGLADCLLEAKIALCPSGIAGEKVEAELETGGIPDVESDAGEEEDEPTTVPGLDANIQGEIEVGDSVEGVLEPDEKHGWVYSGDPVFVDITLESGEELDGVLEVYDAESELVASSDFGITGERERLANIELGEGGAYTIVVSEFFNEGGTYELALSETSTNRNSVFIFVDDDGTPLSGGVVSFEALEAAMPASVDVSIWIASVDGPLLADTLDGFGAVIWDSGDYRGDGFDDDTGILLSYFLDGGNLFITGSAPALFEPLELALLSDVEIGDDDSPLLDGLDAGAVLALDREYETAVISRADFAEDDIILMLRGPGSADSGEVAGSAFADDTSSSKIVALYYPFAALPESERTTVLGNILAWFGVG